MSAGRNMGGDSVCQRCLDNRTRYGHEIKRMRKALRYDQPFDQTQLLIEKAKVNACERCGGTGRVPKGLQGPGGQLAAQS